jgi:hypothetical protein
MMLRYAGVLFFLSFFLHSVLLEGGFRFAVNLTSEGKPNATIVVSKKPTKAAQLGAYELQWHIKQMSGAELPIATDETSVTGNRILVGTSRFTEKLGINASDFKSQEYTVMFRPGTIILAGKDKEDYGEVAYDINKNPSASSTWPGIWDEQGTLYAVYDLLERYCDIRWFNHTEYGTEIPQRRTITLRGTTLKRKPFFHYRFACYHDSANYDRYISLQPRSADDWKRFEEQMYPSLHKRFTGNNYTAAKRSFITLFRLRMREGGENVPGNHSLYGYYQRFWDEKSPNFEEKHPEFFAKGYQGTPPQMCYTNPGLIAQVVQDARDFFDGKGKKVGALASGDYFCVEPMDNSFYCKCEGCRKWYGNKGEKDFYSKGTYSDYMFNFVNEIAKEVKKSHPDKYIVTLAYATHAYPPEKITLESNVAVQFCFATNRGSVYSEGYYHELNLLKKWYLESQKSERPIYLWLYYTFPVEGAVNGNYHCFPGFFAHAIGEQFKIFHRYGIKGMFHCGYGQEVEAYVTYRLMNDPTLNIDELLDEYFSRYYGNASQPMKELYLAIEETYTNRENYTAKVGSSQERYWSYLGTEERMKKFGGLLQDAKKLAKTDTEKERIELFETGTWEYMMEGFTKYNTRKKAPLPTVTVPKVENAGGVPEKVDWEKGIKLPEGWYVRGSADRSERNLEGRIAHDGEFLYLRLTDYCETEKLVASASVFPYDDWEVFVAEQRDLPYRQFAFGPGGLIVALSHGEVAWRNNVKIEEHSVKFASDTKAPDRWISYISIPFSDLTQDGVKPGERFYMNIIRVSSPAIGKKHPLSIDSWTSYVTVHEVDRLGEFILGK